MLALIAALRPMIDPELLTLPKIALMPRSAVITPELSRWAGMPLMPKQSDDAIRAVLVTLTVVAKVKVEPLVRMPLLTTFDVPLLALRPNRIALIVPLLRTVMSPVSATMA